MARPTGADSEATKRRILESATGLFAARGRGDVSMRRIARGSQVTQGAVHHYFGSKDALFQACVTEMYEALQPMVSAISQHFEEAHVPASGVRETMGVAIRFSRTHRGAMRLMNRHILDHGEGASPQRERMLRVAIAAATESLTPVSSLTKSELRLALYALVFMVIRILVADPQEVATLVPGTSPQTLESSLGRLACRMLGVPLEA